MKADTQMPDEAQTEEPQADPIPETVAANDLEKDPTPDEARAIFKENPGLWSVKTTEGTLCRDGTYQ